MSDAAGRPYVLLAESGNVARFAFPANSGITLSKAAKLRTILLNELSGIAVKGFEARVVSDEETHSIRHRFNVVEHLVEDVPTLIRHLRNLVFARVERSIAISEMLVFEAEFALDEDNRETVRTIRGADLTEGLLDETFGATIVNGETPIATLVRDDAKPVSLRLRLHLDDREGFVSAEENQKSFVALNDNRAEDEPLAIGIPAWHSPVIRCAFHAEGEGPESSILMEIETRGAATPHEALDEALAIFEQGRPSTES